MIERGQADVIGDGRAIGTLGPGDGFGEIALLRGYRRTASVRATTPMTLCSLNRRMFVTAVAGYSHSASVADSVINERLIGLAPSSNPE